MGMKFRLYNEMLPVLFAASSFYFWGVFLVFSSVLPAVCLGGGNRSITGFCFCFLLRYSILSH